MFFFLPLANGNHLDFRSLEIVTPCICFCGILWHHYDFCWYYNYWKFLACSLNIMLEFGFPWVFHDFFHPFWKRILWKSSFFWGSNGYRPSCKGNTLRPCRLFQTKKLWKKTLRCYFACVMTTPLATNISPFNCTFEAMIFRTSPGGIC